MPEVGETTRRMHDDGINLRLWFAMMLLWMGGLTATSCWGLSVVDGVGGSLGWGAWILGGYAFYMSLCNAFVPAPTTWIVLLVASDLVSAKIGIDHWAARLLIVSTVGAVATGVANLNEYHVFTFLLRYRRVGKVRQTRLYQRAGAWFRTNPFGVIVVFAFLPIPVDVVRWLAIGERYSRVKFFWAYFLGRWFRYALLASAAVGFHLDPLTIAAIQGVLVVGVGVRYFVSWRRSKRNGMTGHAGEQRGEAVGGEIVMSDEALSDEADAIPSAANAREGEAERVVVQEVSGG